MFNTSSFSDVIRNLNWSVLTDMLLAVIPALICITLHELSHGFVAYKLGDNTAKNMGRLTLNPIKHIDIFGLIMMVVLKFGWAKPVPVNMRNFKNPKRDMAITALAGPLSNVLICRAVHLRPRVSALQSCRYGVCKVAPVCGLHNGIFEHCTCNF